MPKFATKILFENIGMHSWCIFSYLNEKVQDKYSQVVEYKINTKIHPHFYTLSNEHFKKEYQETA